MPCLQVPFCGGGNDEVLAAIQLVVVRKRCD